MPNTQLTADEQVFITFYSTATPDELKRLAMELEAGCDRGEVQDRSTMLELCKMFRDKAQEAENG